MLTPSTLTTEDDDNAAAEKNAAKVLKNLKVKAVPVKKKKAAPSREGSDEEDEVELSHGRSFSGASRSFIFTFRAH